MDGTAVGSVNKELRSVLSHLGQEIVDALARYRPVSLIVVRIIRRTASPITPRIMGRPDELERGRMTIRKSDRN
jgi:hypothetical protein